MDSMSGSRVVRLATRAAFVAKRGSLDQVGWASSVARMEKRRSLPPPMRMSLSAVGKPR